MVFDFKEMTVGQLSELMRIAGRIVEDVEFHKVVRFETLLKRHSKRVMEALLCVLKDAGALTFDDKLTARCLPVEKADAKKKDNETSSDG